MRKSPKFSPEVQDQGACDRFGVRGTEGASAVVGVHFTLVGAAACFGGALPA